MTNSEIVRLLKKLRWDRYTGDAWDHKECNSCGVSYIPAYEKPPRHKKSCEISRAIRQLSK